MKFNLITIIFVVWAIASILFIVIEIDRQKANIIEQQEKRDAENAEAMHGMRLNDRSKVSDYPIEVIVE